MTCTQCKVDKILRFFEGYKCTYDTCVTCRRINNSLNKKEKRPKLYKLECEICFNIFKSYNNCATECVACAKELEEVDKQWELKQKSVKVRHCKNCDNILSGDRYFQCKICLPDNYQVSGQKFFEGESIFDYV